MPPARGLDKETAASMQRGEVLRGLTRSEGWTMVKEMLHARIKEIESITSIPNDLSPEEAGIEMMKRMGAIEIVLGWVSEIEGEVEQFHEQAAVLAQVHAENVITRYSS